MEIQPKDNALRAVGVALGFLVSVFLLEAGFGSDTAWSSLYGLAALASLWVAGYMATFLITAAAFALAAIGPDGGLLAPGAEPLSRAVPCLVVVLSTGTVLVRKYLGQRAAQYPSGRLGAFIGAAPSFVWVCDSAGRITYVNEALCRFTGVTRQEVQDRGWQFNVHPDDRVDMENGFKRLAASPRPFTKEFRMRRSDGTYRWIFEQANPVFGEDGAFLGFVGNSMDTTARRDAEDEIRKSQETFEKAEEIGKVGTWRFDVKGDRAEWSRQVYVMCGIEADEWDKSLDWFVQSVLHESDRKRYVEWAKALLKGENPGRLEYRIVRRNDGAERWLLAEAEAFSDESGETIEVVGISHDVTETRHANAALAESRARLIEAERIAGMGHVEWNPETEEVVWSDGMFDLLGIEKHSIKPGLGRYLGFVAADDREKLRMAVVDALKTGNWRPTVHRLNRPDGSPRIVRVSGRVAKHFLTDGRRLFSILEDITDRYRNEEALRDSEAFLSKAQEIARLGSWTYNMQSGERTWSRELYRICGLSPEDPVPSVEDFAGKIVHPLDREGFESGWEQVLKEGVAGHTEYRIVRPDGTARAVSAQCEVVPETIDKPATVIGTFQDITEVRRAQIALQESEERFDLAARGANDGLWDWSDVRKDELWISPRFFELLGYEDGAFDPNVGHFLEAGDRVHPDDREKAWSAIMAHLEHRVPYDVEFRLMMKNDGYRWFQARGEAVFDDSGAAVRMAGSAQDIHDRKIAEEKLNQYREQLRSLASKAVLAGEHERRRIGIELHDRTIQNLGLMRVRLAGLRASVDGASGGTLFEETFSLVTETIRDTRALLSELSPPVLYELGFETGVDWLAERVRVQHDLDCTVIDDGQSKPLSEDSQVILFQAVRELLANVAKHAEARKVRVDLRHGDDEICVTVEDDGKGLDVGGAPFEMTEEGGFGLFSIRERMAFLGGRLELRSESGKGTTAILRAPLAVSSKREAERVA